MNIERKYQCIGSAGRRRARGVCRGYLLVWLVVAVLGSDIIEAGGTKRKCNNIDLQEIKGQMRAKCTENLSSRSSAVETPSWVESAGGGIQTASTKEQKRRTKDYRPTKNAQRRFLRGLEEELKSSENPNPLAFESWPIANNFLGFKKVRQLVPYEQGEDIREKLYRISLEAMNAEEYAQIMDSSKETSTSKAAETQPRIIDKSISEYVEKRCTNELKGSRFSTAYYLQIMPTQ